MGKSAVVIGGNFAGVIAAKKLAKHGFDVVVIAPNDSAYMSPSTPRLLNQPEGVKNATIKLDKVFKPLKIKHIKNSVINLDPNNNSLTLDNEKVINYEYLIIASGTSHNNEIFKPSPTSSADQSVKLIQNLSKKIKGSKKIAIIGGGATGVEVAGDIAYYNKGSKVSLYTGGKHPLAALPENKQLQAESLLSKQGVKVINSKVVDFTEYTVDGEQFDLVISATGVKPNNSFIPKDLLDSRGYLKVDKHLSTKYSNILGFGDIASISDQTLVSIIMAQVKILENLIETKFLGKNVKQKEFSTPKPIALIPIGADGGVGLLFGMGLPQFAVKMMKSKDFRIPKNDSFFDAY